mgnify:CR=1 FL=1
MEKQVYEFIAAQTGEKIVERRKCPGCGQEFTITDKDLEFYCKISPVFNGVKYEIPAPTLCPDCRNQRRLTRRNERNIYKRKCDLTGKPIISDFHPDRDYIVYEESQRITDKWSPKDYGRDYDFARPFFQQFEELSKKVPYPATQSSYNENSDYTNQTGHLKDCYLVFEAAFSENCYYWNDIWTVKDSVDNLKLTNSEQCYQCIECFKCYNVKYSFKSSNCSNSWYLNNCDGCKDCFACVWLNNKQYFIFNEQYTKQDYQWKVKELLEDRKSLEEKYNQFVKTFPLNSVNNIWSNNVFGNNIIESHNIFQSFDIVWCEDLKYCHGVNETKESIDYSLWWTLSERIYECISVWNTAYSILFGINNFDNISNLIYCLNCRFWTKNCFGCVWLHNHEEYYILNKQYTKEEYEKLVPKIIEHMQKTWERWEFFSANISPFGYNETVANEHFPLSRDEAIARWFKWEEKEYLINIPDWIELVKWQNLPDNIRDVNDDILKKAIVCEISWKPFRIVKSELDFYRKHNLPLPRKHPDIRHLERFKKRAPKQLYLRTCDNCGKQVISVYPQNSEFKVYCEECYNKETY